MIFPALAGLKLQLRQPRIEPAGRSQRLMRALLDNAALVEHQNTIARQHRRQPMSNDNRGALTHQLRKRRSNLGLAFGVERRGRLVEQQQRRIAQDCARDRNPLPLSARERNAALANLRFHSCRQRRDKRSGMRVLGGARDLGVGRIRPAEANIVAHRACEHNAVLRHQRNPRPQLRRIEIGEPHTVKCDASGYGIVEAQQQMKNRAFAGSRRADDRDFLAPRNVKRHTIERGHVGRVG